MVIGLEKAQEHILGDSSIEGCLVFQAPDGSLQTWLSPGFTVRKQ
jgi:hypothetical protein